MRVTKEDSRFARELPACDKSSVRDGVTVLGYLTTLPTPIYSANLLHYGLFV